jgi:GNAT superfamily N-acetyltransferase
MQIIGPALDEKAQCEEVLRSLPMWFGIERALVMYADDSLRLPTFAAVEGTKVIGFISLLQHFAHAWEIHCIAVRAESRNEGYGKALMAHAESWLAGQGVSLLQVKTVAATSSSKEYALTREFYCHLGYQPLEVFPKLWDPHNPALQLVKVLPSA